VSTRPDWEEIKRLGEGGQSTVYLVRRPERVASRQNALDTLMHAIPRLSGTNSWGDRIEPAKQLAESALTYARADLPSELGAMKLYKMPSESPDLEQAIRRLQREIDVLKFHHSGLIPLLDSNAKEQWIVTEYFSNGSLEHHLASFQGKAYESLKAFRSLVDTVAYLHEQNVVHRDIKPQNIYVREDGQLVLGDFGIVFVSEGNDRLTITGERVGPRDYMPQWGDLGVRLENVHTSFDVYMLGKLLWCMVAGKSKLPREYQHRPQFDLALLFAEDPRMSLLNALIDKCVVEEPELCLPNAKELLAEVNAAISLFERDGQLLGPKIPRPCRICGRGVYSRSIDEPDSFVSLALEKPFRGARDLAEPMIHMIQVEPWTCSYCGHLQLFSTNK
jgi:serine/threonine protein kinase